MIRRNLLILPLAATLLAILMGVLVLLGWVLHIPLLVSFLPGTVPARFNSGLGIVIAGTALLLQQLPLSARVQFLSRKIAGAALILLALMSLKEYFFPGEPDLDHFFIGLLGLNNHPGSEFPERMSAIAAINFILFGTGLLAFNNRKLLDFQHISLPAISFLSFCVIIGFNLIADVPGHVRMSVPAGLAFILLCFASYYLQPMLKETVSFERNLYTALTAATLLIAMISGLSMYYSNKRIGSNQRIAQANHILRHVEEAFTLAKDIEDNSQGYLLTGDSVYRMNYDSMRQQSLSYVRDLKQIPGQSRQQQARLDSLEVLIGKHCSLVLAEAIMRRQQGPGSSNLVNSTRSDKIYMDQIAALVRAVESEEREVLYNGQRENESSIRSFNHTFLFFLGAVFLLLTIIFFAIRHNIRIRQRAEAESLENRKIFATLFYKSPVMKLIGDLDTGEYLDVNDAFAGFIGYSRHEIIGKSTRELKLLPDSVRRDEIMSQLRRDKQLRNMEMKMIHHSREERWISCNTDVLNINGRNCYISAFTDITQQKATEEALTAFNQELENRVAQRTEDIRRSEERYRYLFANNPMPMWIIDATDYAFLDVNDRALEVYGYSREEFLKMTATDIRPEADRAAFLSMHRHADGEHWNFNRGVWTHLRKDGTPIQVQVFAHEVFFGSNRARLILCNDVTEQKEAEEKLIASEERFRSLIENSAEGIALLDEHMNIIYRSPSSERITGYAPEVNLADLMHPEDFKGIEKSVAESFRQPGIPVHFEGRYKHQRGDYFWLEGTLTNLLQVKGVNAIVSNYRDVTARKESEEKIRQSEQRLRSTLDNMLEGVQIVDFDWRYIYVNEACARQAKSTREELLGHTLMEKFPGVEQTELYNVFRRCFTERIPIHLENEFPFPDGTTGWFELSLQPVPEGIFILSIDITERKRAQEVLQRMNAELEERVASRTAELKRSNEELEAFSYSVSHDLRAPLRGITGFASILQDEYGPEMDEEGKRVVNVIKNNTIRMGQLIDDLLLFSRMGRSELLKNKINSGQLVMEVVNELQSRHEGNPINWQIAELPPVKGDINMIRQVWINLLSNAVKYSRKTAAPLIEVGAYREGGSVVFYVKDNGVGFDEKYKDKLFKVFQRLHSQHEFEGTGVGLAIVDKIISKHGGRVWTTAKQGAGATFYFSLPDEK